MARMVNPGYTNAGSKAGDDGRLVLQPRPAPPTKRVFAEINIVATDTLSPRRDRTRVFHIAWRSKAVRWTYYIVTDLNATETPLRIEDKNASNTAAPLVFSPENQTDLVKHPDPDDVMAQALAQHYPNLHRFRFVSDVAVPCRQVPRKQLQLLLGDERIFASLPNPSLRRYGQDTLFHVITQFTHPSPPTGS